MKQRVWWSLGLIGAVLLESSFLTLPLTLLYVWQVQKHLGSLWGMWMSVVAGIILDILNVKIVGVSSLLFIGFWLGIWGLQRFFSRFMAFELVWLTLFACIWALWSTGSAWPGLLIGGIAYLINRWRGTSLHRGNYLRRL